MTRFLVSAEVPMIKTLVLLRVAALMVGLFVDCSAAKSDGSAPRLLPPSDEFLLVLREDAQKPLPLGASCEGEASRTLMCRAFTVTLQNTGPHTVRISGLSCFEPSITFQRNEPHSSSGWWPISQPGKPTCTTLDWTNTRLQPHERIQYSTRLLSERRWIESVGPGQYKLKAQWVLKGCTESGEDNDCLSPLQDVHQFGRAARIDFQEPVLIESNEITVESPQFGDFGGLKIRFDVTLNTPPEWGPSCRADNTDVECMVFHFAIHNLGDRPIRNATFSCSDSSIQPEYRSGTADWKPLPQVSWSCTMNILTEQVILSGQALEGTFTLRSLRPGYDTSSVRAPGAYQFRFTFWPSACIASPDGAFCLARPEKQPPAASKELTLENPNPKLSGSPRFQQYVRCTVRRAEPAQ
jgi:hypothetical protein